MATKTADQLLREARAMLNQTKKEGSKSYYPATAPTGIVAGASDTQYVPGTTVPIRNYEQGARLGLDGVDAQNEAINYGNQQMGLGGGVYVEPKISSQTASAMGKALGGSGKEFEGLTQSQANSKLDSMKETLRGQQSALTSSIVNPDTLSGFKKQLDNLRIGLDSINNDAFKSQGDKKDSTTAAIGSSVNQLSNLFTPENIQQAMQNPEFQKLAEQYKSMGGDINAVATKVTTPVVGQPQDLSQYLGNLATPEEQKAYQTLLPEQKLAQDQIAFEQSIPDEYKKYYFGSEEEIGIQQQLQDQAEEAIRITERKQKLDTENLKAQADYVAQMNSQELARTNAETEKNRLNSRNYMTGMLAKLGALNTSSAAPIAIANLDQKYQQQMQEATTKVQNANREIEMKLKESVDNIEIETANDILKIKQDLTKSDADVMKDIMKMKQDAQRATFKIIGGFQNDFRSQTEKYRAEAKALAKKNAADYMKIVSNYDVTGLSFNDFINKKQTIDTEFGPIQSTFGIEKRKALVPEFIQNLISSGSISSYLENVLQGEKNIGDYTATNQAKIRAEMTKLGITSDMLKKVASPTSEVGALSKDDLTKGTNYVLLNGTKEDQEKFKTDREFQAFIMGQI